MGTRSKLIIRRRKASSSSGSASKPDIHLWMHWDGYFEGVGDTLVNQIALILAKYSPEKVCEMIVAVDADEDGEPFDSDHLMEFLEGSVTCFFDDCDDIEYKYVLDADTMTLGGNHLGTGDKRTLSFEDIKMGKNFDDFCHDSDDADEEAEDSEEEVVASDADDAAGYLTVRALITKLQAMVKEDPNLANKRVQGDFVFN